MTTTLNPAPQNSKYHRFVQAFGSFQIGDVSFKNCSLNSLLLKVDLKHFKVLRTCIYFENLENKCDR